MAAAIQTIQRFLIMGKAEKKGKGEPGGYVIDTGGSIALLDGQIQNGTKQLTAGRMSTVSNVAALQSNLQPPTYTDRLRASGGCLAK